MEEYESASAEAAYEDPGEQAQMGFIDTGGRFYDGKSFHCWDQEQPSFTIHTCSKNTIWLTVAVHRSVAEEAIIRKQ